MTRIALLIIVFSILIPLDKAAAEEGEVFIITVDSNNLRFSPPTTTLSEGDSVHFLWSGEALAHNAVEENGLFDSGDASRNVDYLFVFKVGTAGTYDFVCEPHESLGMMGTVIVEEKPIDETVPELEAESMPGFSLSMLFLAIIFALQKRPKI